MEEAAVCPEYIVHCTVGADWKGTCRKDMQVREQKPLLAEEDIFEMCPAAKHNTAPQGNKAWKMSQPSGFNPNDSSS